MNDDNNKDFENKEQAKERNWEKDWDEEKSSVTDRLDDDTSEKD